MKRLHLSAVLLALAVSGCNERRVERPVCVYRPGVVEPDRFDRAGYTLTGDGLIGEPSGSLLIKAPDDVTIGRYPKGQWTRVGPCPAPALSSTPEPPVKRGTEDD